MVISKCLFRYRHLWIIGSEEDIDDDDHGDDDDQEEEEEDVDVDDVNDNLIGIRQSFLGDGVPVQPRGEEGGERARGMMMVIMIMMMVVVMIIIMKNHGNHGDNGDHYDVVGFKDAML